MASRKNIDLSRDSDLQMVLDILENSDASFSSDDDLENDCLTLEQMEESDSSDEDDSERDLIPENFVINQKATTSQRTDLWKKKEFVVHDIPIVQGCENFVELGTPLNYFSKYFTETHYTDAVKYTKMYTLATSGTEMSLTETELKNFYGCAIIMSCLGYPQMKMYWEDNYRCEIIAASMSRNKFMRFRNTIHFVDNNKPSETNKLWRVQPVIDLVRSRCNELASAVTSYSIDEQIVPFTGRCPARQVIRSKPRPVGLKNLVCATSDGLVVDFEVFQGAGTFPDCGLGHGPSIVLRLTKCLPKGSHLYFDRFFTTIPLLEKLQDIGFKATGTIMGNRLGKRINFPADKAMARGDMHQFVKDDNVAVVKWCDTKCVTIASTACGKDPIGEVNRWVRNLKRRLPVPIPAVVQLYNSKMGGVDIADQMMEYYRIKTKTRKWPVKVFFHFLDLAIYNSWMEYRKAAKTLGVARNKMKKFLDFKMEIGEVLAKYKGSPLEVSPFELPEDYHG
ncbi:piggyBac transposable element-derived protein 3-like, partial [Rhagoletis pomonella]|uniref:piggyBac transposable element-derived protein 3-like n=1 Tax=Rhagoletis pomonella TaxID=28610 RepID=UPI001785B83C